LRRAQSDLISILDIEEGISLLDVGCGTGWALRRVAELVHDNGAFYGVDLSPKMIERAKESFKGRSNFHFIQSNAESIPLEGVSFDVIICTNSFHHYLNPDRALKEMFRLLRYGGKTYILDPTADTWLIKTVDRVLGRFDTGHVRLYSTMDFQAMFSEAGMNYVRTRDVNSHEKIHIARK